MLQNINNQFLIKTSRRISSNLISMLAKLSYLFFMVGCQSKAGNESESSAMSKYERQLDQVAVVILQKSSFQKEIVCNGKLKAIKKSELKFKVNGELQKIAVKNGNTVAAGQILAILDQFEYKQRVNQAEVMMRKTSNDLQDALLSYGGTRVKKDSIPSSIYEVAAVQSGFVAASSDLKTAEFNLEGTILKAPFDGKVANIKHYVHEQTSAGEVFCTVIDDTEFEVEFYIIESESADVLLSNDVKVIPFSTDMIYSGVISEINPVVDEHGLILVKARVASNGRLWEGMNVKIIIERNVPNQFVVPKAAIVLRQNQDVIFKYVNGKASWTYVKTELENSTSYSIIPHPDKGGELEQGDTVIVSNNLNLAHGSEVELKKSL